MTRHPAKSNSDRGALVRSRGSWGGQLTDWGYAAGWRLVRAAPEFLARNAFSAGAQFAARNGGPEQLRKNLARVIGVPPEQVPDELIRASLASYARYWREAFRLPSMDHAELGKRLSVQDIEMVWSALEHGRGAVLALPHSGNWDMAGVWLVQNHGTFATVAERLKPEALYHRFLRRRRRGRCHVADGDRPGSCPPQSGEGAARPSPTVTETDGHLSYRRLGREHGAHGQQGKEYDECPP